MRGHHFGIGVAVLVVTLFWVGVITAPVPEPVLDIGESLVIYADEPVTPVETTPELFRNPDVQWAIEYRDMLGYHWWTQPLLQEEWRLIDEARPIPEPVRAVRRPPAYLAPAFVQVLVEQYFLPEDVQQAVNVIYCESRFDSNAKNPTSSASGLAQHLKGWWSGEWGVTGAFDPFDPEQSVKAMAALVYNTSSGWGNWYPSQHCWG